jgi:glyoxylase I family protein
MEHVLGIGGFFFRARDPGALNRWYAEHLGIVPPSGDYDAPSWFPDRGETVFTAFAADSDSFGAPEKTWKINFHGRFAEPADPEGNRIQLWQPNAVSLARDPGPGAPRSP